MIPAYFRGTPDDPGRDLHLFLDDFAIEGPLGRHPRPERGGPSSAQSGPGGRPAVGADRGRSQRPL